MALPFNVNKRKWPRVTHRARHEMPATPPVQAPSPEHSAAARCKATRTTMYPPTLGPDEVSPLPKPPPRKPTGKYGIAPWTLETEEDAKAAVQAVASSARAWHELPSAAKIAILQEMHSNTIKATIALGEAIAKTTGFTRNDGTPDMNTKGTTHGLACSLILCATIKRHMETLQEKLPTDVPLVHTTDGGSKVFKARPLSEADKRDPMQGQTAIEIYIQPGKEGTRGKDYGTKHAQPAKGAAIVLGAGNASFLMFVDTMHKLMVDHEPAVLKYHPAQALVAPVLEYIFEPLSRTGAFVGVNCNIEITKFLVHQPEVVSVHMTGGQETHDAIVWGAKRSVQEEREARKAANNPLLKVAITSELGNATPVLLAPSHWDDAGIKLTARKVVENFGSNAGCNCLAPKMVLIPDEWHQADAMIEALKQAIRDSLGHPAWYKGVQEIYDNFCDSHDDVERVMPGKCVDNGDGPPTLPIAIAPVTLDSSSLADAADVPGIAHEFFAPCIVLARISHSRDLSDDTKATLKGLRSHSQATAEVSTAEAKALVELRRAFLVSAVRLVNEHAFGNLVVALYSPESGPEERPPEIQKAVDALEYGSVILNDLTVNGYVSTDSVWGGFQSNNTSAANPQSGVGFVRNALQFDDVEKAALWQSFKHDTGSLDVQMPPVVGRLVAGGMAGGVAGAWKAFWA